MNPRDLEAVCIMHGWDCRMVIPGLIMLRPKQLLSEVVSTSVEDMLDLLILAGVPAHKYTPSCIIIDYRGFLAHNLP